MIMRKPEVKDAYAVWDCLKKQGLSVNINSVVNQLSDDKNESLMTLGKEVSGVILAKKMPDMIEITNWSIKRDDRGLFDELFNKSRGSGYRKIGVMEHEDSRDRIKMLESEGFKVLNEVEGIYPKGKAVILRRRV